MLFFHWFDLAVDTKLWELKKASGRQIWRNGRLLIKKRNKTVRTLFSMSIFKLKWKMSDGLEYSRCTTLDESRSFLLIKLFRFLNWLYNSGLSLTRFRIPEKNFLWFMIIHLVLEFFVIFIITTVLPYWKNVS